MVVFTDGWGNKGSDPVIEARAAEALGFRMLSISVIVSLKKKKLKKLKKFLRIINRMLRL